MTSALITELTETVVQTDFLELMSEIEAGSWFDMQNREHVQWLQCKLARRFGSGGRFYGTRSLDNKPLGLYCLLIEDHLVHQGHAEVLDLGVVAEHRRQGLGKQLMQNAETKAKDAGVCCLYVATYAGDEAAVSFYQHCGFEPVAELPGLNGPDDRGQVYLLKKLAGQG
jgi:GNAT superfamily N-acetyltransferase